MRKLKIGDDVRFLFKGTLCFGQIVYIKDNSYIVSFVYNPGDGRFPENVMYSITEKCIL